MRIETAVFSKSGMESMDKSKLPEPAVMQKLY